MWRKSNPYQTRTGIVFRLAVGLLIFSQTCDVTRIAAQEPVAEKATRASRTARRGAEARSASGYFDQARGFGARKTSTRESGGQRSPRTVSPRTVSPRTVSPRTVSPRKSLSQLRNVKRSPKPADSKPLDKRSSQAPSNNANERLDKIEKQLEEIGSFLKSMKQAPPADTSKGSAYASVSAQPTKPAWNGEISREWLKGIRWRGIGPANMGGRITDLAINEADPSTWWAATGGGGLIKTTNNGISFEHQFDKEATVSIGSIAVAKSDPKIVWVGIR